MIHVPRELPLEMVLCRLLEFAVATFCRICDKRLPLQIYVTLGLTQNNKPNSGGTRTTLAISGFKGIAVGTPVARCPPHRSRRAVFPHRALQNDSLTHAPLDNAPQTV